MDKQTEALRAALEEARKDFLKLRHWRRDADAFDKDMGNSPRAYCEDVEMMEDTARACSRKIDAALALPAEADGKTKEWFLKEYDAAVATVKQNCARGPFPGGKSKDFIDGQTRGITQTLSSIARRIVDVILDDFNPHQGCFCKHCNPQEADAGAEDAKPGKRELIIALAHECRSSILKGNSSATAIYALNKLERLAKDLATTTPPTTAQSAKEK